MIELAKRNARVTSIASKTKLNFIGRSVIQQIRKQVCIERLLYARHGEAGSVIPTLLGQQTLNTKLHEQSFSPFKIRAWKENAQWEHAVGRPELMCRVREAFSGQVILRQGLREELEFGGGGGETILSG